MESATPESLSPIIPQAPDWKAIKERYLQGEDLAPIAEQYGVTVGAISSRAYTHKWKELQIRELLKDEKSTSAEIRGSLIASCLWESRMFRHMDPSASPEKLDLYSRVRLRLVETCGKLLGWDADPLKSAKHVKAIDV